MPLFQHHRPCFHTLVGGGRKTNWQLHLVKGKLANLLKNAQCGKKVTLPSRLSGTSWMALQKRRCFVSWVFSGFPRSPPHPNAGKSWRRNIFASGAAALPSCSCASAFAHGVVRNKGRGPQTQPGVTQRSYCKTVLDCSDSRNHKKKSIKTFALFHCFSVISFLCQPWEEDLNCAIQRASMFLIMKIKTVKK